MKLSLLLLLLHISLLAHPHTFIDIYPDIEVKNGKTSSIHFKWVFDEMTSAMLIMDVDSNGDGKIDAKESRYIYSNYFRSLGDYNFYMHIEVDSKLTKFPEPTNFKATVENHRLCYSFDIKQNYEISKTVFGFGDFDFYIAVMLKKEFTKISGATVKIRDEQESYLGYKMELK